MITFENYVLPKYNLHPDDIHFSAQLQHLYLQQQHKSQLRPNLPLIHVPYTLGNRLPITITYYKKYVIVGIALQIKKAPSTHTQSIHCCTMGKSGSSRWNF